MPDDDDRLEREINEILDKIERFPDPESRRARARNLFLRRAATRVADQQRALLKRLSGIAVSQVMLASFLLILGSFFFGRFLSPMKSWMLLAGVILFVTSFAIMVFTHSGSGQTEHWRGQNVTMRSESLATRLRRWFANRRARR
jgi:hypothetical protein